MVLYSLTKYHSLLASLEQPLTKKNTSELNVQDKLRAKQERKVCGELTMNQKEVEYAHLYVFCNLILGFVLFLLGFLSGPW